ncbi:hypothetical protein PSEUBRA_001740 [Kalmanozyma brasiliensis GHG001]|nr:uncharacterized protein PSEUBRA_001740 [Kalmanozyma brasiliensis GHG001]EST08665.2 hypothetical protein PSEUBRA_001740 [Kalmanozyma brasiliensis GHG001]
MASCGDIARHDGGPAAQPYEDGHSSIRKLPLELLYHIIRLAASTDHKTAHVCAYISKLVCRWTAPDRWRTIICTDVRQIEALWEIVENPPPSLWPSSQSDKTFTSLPSRQPARFVENLFIDTLPESLPSKLTTSTGSPTDLRTILNLQAKHQQMKPCWAERCPHLDASNVLVHGPGHLPHRVYSILRHFQHVNYLALGPVEVKLLRVHSVSPAKMLCLADGDDALKCILYTPPHPISYAGRIRHTHQEALWRADGSGNWRPSLEQFRRRLRSLHFICIDPKSELSGISMPFKEVDAMRSGSFGSLSFLRQMADHELSGLPPRLSHEEKQNALASKWYIWPAEDPKGKRRHVEGSDPLAPGTATASSADESTTMAELDPFENEYSRIRPSFWTDFQQGVTKIRYDTRKFAFRPCEITASRLKPFFEELSTTGGNAAHSHSENPSASFTHSGPRHAAPHRGAGHFSKPDPGGQHSREASTSKQAALNSFGCNQFQQLHLCWDPVPGAEGVDQTATANNPAAGTVPSAMSKLSLNGGSDWPAERHDIWTNTTSQNNEARAPPPHTSKAAAAHKSAATRSESATTSLNPWIIPSAIESKQSKAFRADLVDSIRTTFGWTRQDQQLLSDTPWLSNGADLDQRLEGQERRHRLENLVSEIAYQQTPPSSDQDVAHANRGISSDEKLSVRLVPPAERLRLGGMYVPYTKSQRVQWFLDNLDTDDA